MLEADEVDTAIAWLDAEAERLASYEVDLMLEIAAITPMWDGCGVKVAAE